MANPKYNKYIGARYVPIIVGEWSKENTYEPLMIVTYQGASYTSKTFIPKGVEITNTKYWVVTGNYNAQVEQYRSEVVQYKSETDKKIEDILNGIPDINIDGGVF